jgi:hypothetical protein
MEEVEGRCGDGFGGLAVFPLFFSLRPDYISACDEFGAGIAKSTRPDGGVF